MICQFQTWRHIIGVTYCSFQKFPLEEKFTNCVCQVQNQAILLYFSFFNIIFSIQVILTPVLRGCVINLNNFLVQIYFQLFIFNFLLDIFDNIFYNGNIAEKLFPSTAIQVSHISDYGWLCLPLFYEPWIFLDAFNFLPLVMHVFFLLIYFRWMMSLKSNYLSLVTWFSFVVSIFLIWIITGI